MEYNVQHYLPGFSIRNNPYGLDYNQNRGEIAIASKRLANYFMKTYSRPGIKNLLHSVISKAKAYINKCYETVTNIADFKTIREYFCKDIVNESIAYNTKEATSQTYHYTSNEQDTTNLQRENQQSAASQQNTLQNKHTTTETTCTSAISEHASHHQTCNLSTNFSI